MAGRKKQKKAKAAKVHKPWTPKLGDGAQDRITQLTGIITAKAQYMSGLTNYLLEGYDGKRYEEWFEEGRLQPYGRDKDGDY